MGNRVPSPKWKRGGGINGWTLTCGPFDAIARKDLAPGVGKEHGYLVYVVSGNGERLIVAEDNFDCDDVSEMQLAAEDALAEIAAAIGKALGR